MCEQQFDFVCAHITRLKHTQRKKEYIGFLLSHSLLSLLERCSFAHGAHLLFNAKKLKLHCEFFFLKHFQ